MKYKYVFESEKIHSVRYSADSKEAPMLTIYVAKKSLPEPFPKEVWITIEV